MSHYPLACLCGSPRVPTSWRLSTTQRGSDYEPCKCLVYVPCHPMSKCQVGFSTEDPDRATHRRTRPGTPKKAGASHKHPAQVYGICPLSQGHSASPRSCVLTHPRLLASLFFSSVLKSATGSSFRTGGDQWCAQLYFD